MQFQRAQHVAGSDAVGTFEEFLTAAHGAMHDGHDADEDGREEVDGDRAGPARNEVGGIAQHRFGRRQRHVAAIGHLRLRGEDEAFDMLRYSLRSLHMYCSFVRRVMLVVPRYSKVCDSTSALLCFFFSLA